LPPAAKPPPDSRSRSRASARWAGETPAARTNPPFDPSQEGSRLLQPSQEGNRRLPPAQEGSQVPPNAGSPRGRESGWVHGPQAGLKGIKDSARNYPPLTPPRRGTGDRPLTA